MAGKESLGDPASIPQWGRSSGEGNATHSCSGLENSMDGIVVVRGVSKSPTRLSDLHFPTLLPHTGLCPRDETTEQRP